MNIVGLDGGGSIAYSTTLIQGVTALTALMIYILMAAAPLLRVALILNAGGHIEIICTH